MFRRIWVILVAVGFLASQWATLQHAHPGMPGTDAQHHRGQPHIHFPLTQCEATESCQAEANGARGPLLSHAHHHDADAIYLPGSTSIGDSKLIGRDLDVCSLSNVTATVLSVEGQVAFHPATAWWRPPNEHDPSCPLFLTLRTLRI